MAVGWCSLCQAGSGHLLHEASPESYLEVGQRDGDDAVKAPRARERVVKRCGAVGGGHDHHARVVLKAVHLCIGTASSRQATPCHALLLLPRQCQRDVHNHCLNRDSMTCIDLALAHIAAPESGNAVPRVRMLTSACLVT